MPRLFPSEGDHLCWDAAGVLVQKPGKSQIDQDELVILPTFKD